jgi:nitroreductase
MPDNLTPDELLSTTRSVRRRLDLTRPVEPALVDECVELALQAPTSVGREHWHFVVVEDAAVRRGLAQLYRRAWSDYADGASPDTERPAETPGQRSSRYLAAHLHEVPVHVVPCVEGRPEGKSSGELAELYGSVIQAAWSLQLAARARGLGSVFTTYHLDYERDAADILGIPYEQVCQVALIPVAHTLGTGFRPAARRRGLDQVVHRNRW